MKLSCEFVARELLPSRSVGIIEPLESNIEEEIRFTKELVVRVLIPYSIVVAPSPYSLRDLDINC